MAVGKTVFWDDDDLARFEEVIRSQPRSFTDMGPFWRGGKHTLIHGITGSGKTTLLLTLLRELHEDGHRILMRDDGGMEWAYLLPWVPMVVWIPGEPGVSLEIEEGAESYVSEVRRFSHPREILDQVFKTRQRFHVAVHDPFCHTPGPEALFASRLFTELIFKCKQTPRREKRKLIVSIDELNDLVQPQRKSLTKSHASVRDLLSYNIRKLRKHKVTLMATTQRFKQVGIDVRSQFSYIFIKQSYGDDVYDFINKNLVTAAGQTFWRIIRELTTMSPDLFYMFDYKNNYDRLNFPDIPRPDINVKAEGEVGRGEGKDRRFDDKDLYIAQGRAQDPPLSLRDLADRLDLSPSTIHHRLEKIRKSRNRLLQETIQ